MSCILADTNQIIANFRQSLFFTLKELRDIIIWSLIGQIQIELFRMSCIILARFSHDSLEFKGEFGGL